MRFFICREKGLRIFWCRERGLRYISREMDPRVKSRYPESFWFLGLWCPLFGTKNIFCTLPYCEEQWNSLMLSLTRTLDYLCSSYHLDFCGDHHFISCPDVKMTKVHVWDWTNLMRIQTTFQTSLSLRQFHLGLLFCASLPSPAPPAPLAPVTSRSTNNSKKNLVRLGKKSVKPRSTNYNKITWSASVRMISPQGSPCCTCQ